MNIQPYRWMNLTETNADLICAVLDKYCVHYKLIRNEDETPFIFRGPDLYTIEVQLDRDCKVLADGTLGESPLSFILGKVNEQLKISKEKSLLENSFKRNIVDPHPFLNKDDKPNTFENTSFEPIGKILEQNLKNPKKGSFWDKFKNHIMKKEVSFGEKFKNFFTKRDETDEECIDINPFNALNGVLSDVLDALCTVPFSGGDIISFDDLSPFEQKILSKDTPVEILRSSKCTIRRIKQDGGYKYSVCIRAND